MHLSKSQAAVITALNVVIVALVAVVFLVPLGGVPASGSGDKLPTGGETQEHVKLREASKGAVPEIIRETRLMGNGDESVVAVYFRGGVSYIFGNATVKGLDFDSFGGFLCLVDGAGTILVFSYFDGAVSAVGVVGGGYAVGAGNKLYFADYEGAIEVVAELDGTAREFLAVSPTKLAAVTELSENSFKLTEYYIEDGWKAGNNTRIYSIRKLKYFGCYAFDDYYVISARATSETGYAAVAFFSFKAGGMPTEYYEGGAVENVTRPFAVMPHGKEFFAAVTRNGKAGIISLDNSFSLFRSISLGLEAANARLFNVGEKCYACFFASGGAVTYDVDDELGCAKLDAWDGMEIDRVLLFGEPTAVGNKNGGAVIAPLSGKAIELDTQNAVFYGGFMSADGYTLVMSATGGGALSKPTAGRDVYVITVRR
ncbi:MAG: hypothetical protein J1G38_01340 [Clostridiales bacterium]|nr:hypothetical protein [Clostridiales bacterium]